MHYPIDRIAHTTAFVTPVVEHWLEQEIAQWVHPMKDRSNDLSHHKQTFLPQSYSNIIEAIYYVKYGRNATHGGLIVLFLVPASDPRLD